MTATDVVILGFLIDSSFALGIGAYWLFLQIPGEDDVSQAEAWIAHMDEKVEG